MGSASKAHLWRGSLQTLGTTQFMATSLPDAEQALRVRCSAIKPGVFIAIPGMPGHAPHVKGHAPD